MRTILSVGFENGTDIGFAKAGDIKNVSFDTLNWSFQFSVSMDTLFVPLSVAKQICASFANPAL